MANLPATFKKNRYKNMDQRGFIMVKLRAFAIVWFYLTTPIRNMFKPRSIGNFKLEQSLLAIEKLGKVGVYSELILKSFGFWQEKKERTYWVFIWWATDQYKLITTVAGETYELYDLIQDKSET